MSGQPFRLQPALPPAAYKTYAVLMPKQTHTRVASCAEVECQHHLRGWTTKADSSTTLGRKQARYIRLFSGRAYTSSVAGGIVTFTFPPGQKCFTEHRVALEREPLFVVRGGDWRGNPLGTRMRHANGRDWVDDFGAHQLTIKDQIERG